MNWAYNSQFNVFEKAIVEKFNENINDKSSSLDVEAFFEEVSTDVNFPGISIVNEFISSLNKHEVVKPSGLSLYRSRLVDSSDKFFKLQIEENQVYGLVPEESSIPLFVEKIHGKRANHRGVPNLYLAGDKYTTISEVAPFNFCMISVAEFKIVQDIRLVNLAFCGRQKPSGIEDNETLKDFARICSLSFAFTKPNNKQNESEYAPTQYISYRIKKEGVYSGIIYDSLKSNGGLNIVLFNSNLVSFYKSELVRCYGLEYKIQNITYEVENSPMLSKKYTSPKKGDIKAIKEMIIKHNKSKENSS